MARLPIDRFTWPWGDAEQCPCGSGETFGGCCKRGPRQLPYVRVPGIAPLPPATGHAHPRCYMASTRDCSTKISREHYISRVILEEFPELQISGLPWHADEVPVKYGIEALTAKILCARHNSALAPIDALAAKAFRTFILAPYYAVTQRHPGRAEHHLVSGDALELWMLKLMAGIYYGGIASDQGIRARDIYDVPEDILVNALAGAALPAGAGLYATQGPGLMQRKALGVAPMIDPENRNMIGVQVHFGTLRFDTLLVPPPRQAFNSVKVQQRYRPGIIDFNGRARDSRIVLSWRNQGNEINRLGLEIAAS